MKNLIILLLLISCTNLSAQHFQLAGIEYNYYPSAAIIDGAENQEIAFNEIGFFFNLPKKINKDKTIILNTLNYNLVQSSISNTPIISSLENGGKLHKLSYSFTIAHKLNEGWTWVNKIKPTIASDFNDKLSKNDFLFQGATLITRKIKEHFTVGAGAVYTTQTGRPRLLPTLQFKYHKNRHLVDILLPSKVKYSYKLDEAGKFRLGIKGSFDGGDYNINIQDFIAAEASSIDNVIYTRANLGLLFHVILTNTFHLELNGGISAARKYQFENFDDLAFKYDAGNGQFFHIGLYYVLHKKE